ncbi:MAG: hypothetical protein R3C62_09635 [Chloroflexota bacterium]
MTPAVRYGKGGVYHVGLIERGDKLLYTAHTCFSFSAQAYQAQSLHKPAKFKPMSQLLHVFVENNEFMLQNVPYSKKNVGLR